MPAANDLVVVQLDAAIAAVARRIADADDMEANDVQALGVACWHMAAARDNLDPLPRPESPRYRKPSDT